MSENISGEYSVPQTTQGAPNAQPIQSQPQEVSRMSNNVVPEDPSGDMQVKTPYQYLQDAFNQETRTEPITLEVPRRPGVWIEFDTNITSEQFEMWRKQATVGSRRRGQDADVDNVKFAALVIFNKATIFKIDGQDVYLDNAETKPLNFFEQTEIRNLTGVNTTTNTELVKSVYLNDANVMSAGSQIIEAAGYGDELAEFKDSPTRR